MTTIRLELPTEEHERGANAFKEEFFSCGEDLIHGSNLFDQLEYPAWLHHTKGNRESGTPELDWAPSTTFFAVLADTGEIVGMIDIRHHIKNPILAKYGGHIGFAVRPTVRKKGYASQMLTLGLAYAKELGFEKVMLGCYADNIGSMNTIKKCGGVFEREALHADGKSMSVYWIKC